LRAFGAVFVLLDLNLRLLGLILGAFTLRGC